MRVLIDECLPAGLKESLAALGYEADTVRRAGYGAKKNGELLSLMEGRWDVLVTNDRNIRHQQNMIGRNVSIFGSVREIKSHKGFAAADAAVR